SWPSGPARAPAASASGSLTGFSGAGLVLRGVFCASRSILIVLEPALGPLKLADAAADGFAHLRELSRPQDDQGQHQDDEELGRADVSRHALYSFQPARDRRPAPAAGQNERFRTPSAIWRSISLTSPLPSKSERASFACSVNRLATSKAYSTDPRVRTSSSTRWISGPVIASPFPMSAAASPRYPSARSVCSTGRVRIPERKS